MNNYIALCNLAIIALIAVSSAQASHRPVTVAMHVHSTYSENGVLTLEQIAETARAAGIQVVILADHDLQQWTYGIVPFETFIKWTVTKKSVLHSGAQEYFDHIEKVNRQYPDVLLIGGVESAPFYYWSGGILSGGLTLHQWHKHMLITGLPSPRDYTRLPLVGNGSPFDQYHGAQGDAPYQAVIDCVNTNAPGGGLVFWAHPESPNYEKREKKGMISVETPPYPASLLNTRDYTGFAYFQEGEKTIGVPGGVWDRVLEQYCLAARKKPVWAVAELDYRAEGYLNTWFDSFTNTLMMDEQDALNRDQVFRHLRAGRFYCSFTPRIAAGLFLENYALIDGMLDIRVRARDRSAQPATITIISNGKKVGSFDAVTPADIRFRAPGRPDRKSYYRVEVTSRNNGKIVTNPLFRDKTRP